MNPTILPDLAAAREVLDDAGITWWIDSGTLLGPYRDGAPLPWEKDIDLSCWAEPDPAKWARLEAGLTELGYRVKPRPYRGMVFQYVTHPRASRRRRVWVDIKVFRRDGDTAWCPSKIYQLSPYRIPSPRWLVYGLLRRPVKWVWRRTSLLDHRDDTKARLRRIGLSVCTWAVPARFFDDLAELDIGGHAYPVPAPTEEYLTLRYGDWRTPVQGWSYWTQDGTFVQSPPEAVVHVDGGQPPLRTTRHSPLLRPLLRGA